jgi:hypothetical protein
VLFSLLKDIRVTLNSAIESVGAIGISRVLTLGKIQELYLYQIREILELPVFLDLTETETSNDQNNPQIMASMLAVLGDLAEMQAHIPMDALVHSNPFGSPSSNFGNLKPSSSKHRQANLPLPISNDSPRLESSTQSTASSPQSASQKKKTRKNFQKWQIAIVSFLFRLILSSWNGWNHMSRIRFLARLTRRR